MKALKSLTASVVLAMGLTSGCAVLDMERNSGDDVHAENAMEIPIDSLVMDHVSCTNGDKTDWKFFQTGQGGRMNITFAFDETNANGTICVYTNQNKELSCTEFTHRDTERKVIDLDADPDSFYLLKIYCQSFESVYSIEVTHQ